MFENPKNLSNDELMKKIVEKFKIMIVGTNITDRGWNYFNTCRTVNEQIVVSPFIIGPGSAIRKYGDIQLNKYLKEIDRRFGKNEGVRIKNYLWSIVLKNSEGK